MSKRIPLTQGKFAIVDDEDYEWLNQWKWYYREHPHKRTGYASRQIFTNGKRTTQLMHRLILNVPNRLITDHVNGDGIDNRRANMRTCTTSQNMMNSRLYETNTSGFMGVHRQGRKWKAQIFMDRTNYYLGRFDDLKQAAQAYDAAAL